MDMSRLDTLDESIFIGYCLEGLFYGRIILYSMTITLCAKSLPGVGIYSGIFVIYLRHEESMKSKRATILFYLLCALYVLSTALVAIDITRYIIEVGDNSVYNNKPFHAIGCAGTQQWFQLCGSLLHNFIRHKWLVRFLCGIYLSTHKPSYHSFYLSNIRRYTVAGSCGIEISMS